MNLNITQWISVKKIDLNKIGVFDNFFTNCQICRHFGPLFALVSSQLFLGLAGVVTCSGTCDINLHSQFSTSHGITSRLLKIPERCIAVRCGNVSGNE